MQRHLEALVAVLVVHVVDRVERVHVQLGEPRHDLVEVDHDLLEDEGAALAEDAQLRADLRVVEGDVHAAVDRVEQGLGEVDARAEELELLADAHRGDAAGDAVVVAELREHERVVLVLDGRGADRDFGAEALEGLGQARAPEHGEIGLGGGTEVDEGVEESVGRLGDHVPAVPGHPRERLGDPGGVAGEDLVVRRHAQEAHHAKLHDEMVDHLLDLLLVVGPGGEVGLGVAVEEGGDAPDGHGGAVLLLDRREVGEVEPLDRLLHVARRARDVEAVCGGHRLQLVEGADLLGGLLALADEAGVHDVADHLVLGGLLHLDEEGGAIERYAAVVADDAPAPVGVGEAGDDARVARELHLVGVRVEDAVVVRLAVVEDALDFGIHLAPVGLELGADEADAAEGHDGALEGRIRLEADDLLEIAVDVAGGVGGDRGDGRGVDVVDAPAPPLLVHERDDLSPQRAGSLRGGFQERAVAVVGRVVALDEVADVDFVLPGARLEFHGVSISRGAGWRP